MKSKIVTLQPVICVLTPDLNLLSLLIILTQAATNDTARTTTPQVLVAAQSKGALTKAMIVDQALKIASGQGLEGLTVGLLAEALAMSKSGVFAHFGSREELQLAVVREYYQRFESSRVRNNKSEAPTSLFGMKRVAIIPLQMYVRYRKPAGKPPMAMRMPAMKRH